MRGAVARSSGRRRAVPGAWHRLSNSTSGVFATLVLDYSGAVGGRFFADDNNNLDFDDTHNFARASVATQKDVAGLVKFAPHNAVLQSEDISTWNNSNSTDAVNVTTAPDGTLTADELIEDTSVNKHSVFRGNSFAVGNTNHSAWFKANTRNHGTLVLGSSGNGRGAIFDLVNGVVAFDNVQDGSGGTVVSAFGSMESYPDGWWLCTITVVTTLIQATIVGISDGLAATFNYSGTSPLSIYVWGIHDYRAPMAPALDTFAPTYVPTAAANVFQHRLDHDPVTGARLGLLFEEKRTNRCLQSASPTTSPWASDDATFGTDETTAPDGTTTADSFILTGQGNVRQQITITPNVNHALSIFVKPKSGGGFFRLFSINVGLSMFFNAWFNLDTGAWATEANGGGGLIDSTSVEVLKDGWFKITMVGNMGATTEVLHRYIITDADNSGTRSTTKSCYVWGAGLEDPVEFSTSHIPTLTGTVAREKDVISLVASGGLPHAGYDTAKDTYAVGFTLTDVTAEQVLLSLNDGTTDNRIELYVDSGSLKVRVIAATSSQADITLGTVTAGQAHTAAFSFITDAIRGSLDGATEVNDLVANTIPSVSQCDIFSQFGTTNLVGQGWLSYLKQYPSAFSGAELLGVAT